MRSTDNLPIRKLKWYKLDNAANLYPAIRSRKNSGVFRISAELNEPIDPIQLQSALDKTIQRIPNFSVKLRSGLFWHYFVHSDEQILIQEDVSNPCMAMTKESTDGFLIRVRYHHHMVALEVFHSITDGHGALVFLKTLIAQYLTLQGISIPPGSEVLDCDERPKKEEVQDNFFDFSKNSPTRATVKSRAYHVKGTSLGSNKLGVIVGIIPQESLKQSAKLFGATITEYLTAVFLKVLNDHQLKRTIRINLPVKVQVPVNLRKFTQSQTLRNFSAFVTPSIDPSHGRYSFDEIVELVHHFLRYEASEKHLRAQVAGNVRYAAHPLVRILPLIIKNEVINLVYKISGPSSFTSTLSNLGKIALPPEMEKHVRSFGFILGASPGTNLSCAVLGYKGNLNITFSRVIHETDIERRFFSFLVGFGISAHVENYQE